MLFLVFWGRKRLVHLFIFLELSGLSIEIPCFPERFYELTLFSESLDGYENFLLLLGDLNSVTSSYNYFLREKTLTD